MFIMIINNMNLCDSCFLTLQENATVCPLCAGSENTYPSALPQGTILMGRYIVGKVLGKGGFGITYLAYDTRDDRRAALKEYLPDTFIHRGTGDTEVSMSSADYSEAFQKGKERFYEEAQTVSRFNGNPGLAGVFEFFYENNTAYFVMEYLEGVDLKKYTVQNGGTLTEQKILEFVNSLIDSLIVVHSIGVLHRDIAPDNIYITNDGKVKLIDFGAARQVLGEVSKSLSVVLKQGFAPIEQYQTRGKQGPWTDIYALGATIYHCLTGQIPDQPMDRLDHDTFLPPEHISDGLKYVLSKMLAVRAVNRYQSMFELKADMQSRGLLPNITPDFPEPLPSIPVQTVPPQNEHILQPQVQLAPLKQKKPLNKLPIIIGGIAACLVISVAVIIIAVLSSSGGGNNGNAARTINRGGFFGLFGDNSYCSWCGESDCDYDCCTTCLKQDCPADGNCCFWCGEDREICQLNCCRFCGALECDCCPWCDETSCICCPWCGERRFNCEHCSWCGRDRSICEYDCCPWCGELNCDFDCCRRCRKDNCTDFPNCPIVGITFLPIPDRTATPEIPATPDNNVTTPARTTTTPRQTTTTPAQTTTTPRQTTTTPTQTTTTQTTTTPTQTTTTPAQTTTTPRQTTTAPPTTTTRATTTTAPAAPTHITIKGVQYSTSLTELNLGSLSLTNADIEPLRHMTNLTTLNLRVNNITDLSPLSGLTKLTWLNVFNNNVSNIDALSGLTNLDTLFISENPITNLSPLRNLTKLKGLYAYNCNFNDVTTLHRLTKLETLMISDNPLTTAQINALRAALPNCDIVF